MSTPQSHNRLFRTRVFSTTDCDWPVFAASELGIVPAAMRGMWRTAKGDAQVELGAVTADYRACFTTHDAEYTTHVFEAHGGCDFDATSSTFHITGARVALTQRPSCGEPRTLSLATMTLSASFALDGDCMRVTIQSDSGVNACTWELLRHRPVIAAS